MKRVLLTGGSGLLGNHIARQLLADGYELRLLLRPSSTRDTLEELDCEILDGDVTDRAETYRAIAGCQYVIHAAANTDVWPSYSEEQMITNVKGTEFIIKACLETGVERMIHVSTANAFGFGSKEAPGNEKSPYKSGIYGLGYIQSKYEAQKSVEAAIASDELPAVIVNPTFMWGAYDTKPSSGAMILAVAKGEAPGYPAGGKNFVYVGDVARAICNALVKGKTGESYIMGNQNLSYQEAFSLIAETLNVKAPSIALPAWATRLYGQWGSFIGSSTGSTPKVSLPMAKISCDGHYFTAEKAVKELELPQTDLKIAITEAANWFREKGYL